MEPELLLEAHADLGEGPAWDAANSRLIWVDIHAGDLHIFEPYSGTDSRFSLGEALGCAAPCRDGGVIVALRSGIAVFDLATHRFTSLVSPEPQMPGNRFNDGKCDPAGRFLVGTMDNAEKEACGSLYSYSTKEGLRTLLSGTRISNGLAWSPDFHTIYHIDTPTRLVMAYDYNLEEGSLEKPRPAIRIPEGFGWPDGMTCDREGMLWVALWEGAKVTCWNPVNGELLEAIPLPALNVTSCVFGGENLTDLYITSACKGLNAGQLKDYPLSGALFRLRTTTQGMPTFTFAG
jgi:sugar lactone lactonase YvrE